MERNRIEDALFDEYCAQPDRPVELRMCRVTEVSEPRLTACVDMADWERFRDERMKAAS